MGWSTSSPADGVLQVHEQAQGGDVGKANHWNRIQVNPMALQLRSPASGDLVFLVIFHTFKHILQELLNLTSMESQPGFPPISLKHPPPHHPPAVQVQSMEMKTSNVSSYSPLPSSFPPPPGSPASLHLRLEEAHLQLRAMEKERKRAEAALARHHPGLSRLSGSTSFPSVGNCAPRLPPNPSRLERLVVDSWREHSRVLTLLDRMTKVQGAPQHPGISASFQGWQEAVLALAELRRGAVGEVSSFS